jgi:hypothetical protein
MKGILNKFGAIASSRRDLLMDLGTDGDYDFNTYGMYAFRYLNREYNGDVFLGYLDGVGTTQGFTPAEIADGTLASFANGGKVRVKTLYDQSGNGNHATQSGRWNMPEIMNSSGVLQTVNGRPAMDFDGTNDFMPLSSALPNIRIGHCSSFCVGESDDAVNSAHAMMLTLGWTNSSARWYVPSLYSSNFNFGYASTWNIDTASADTDPHLFTGIAGSTQGNFQPFIDGVSTGSFTRHVRNSAGTYGIGGGKNTTSYALDGRVAEVLVFDGDCSPKRTVIEKNINDYYGL